jgi:NAD(P)-dependent dehydrogenase (short-subunit alcohol dehydrogenase family)
MRFRDRVVIVTGGSRGIGAGCVRVFHREGGDVVILDRDETQAGVLAAELAGQSPGRVATRQVDVADPEALKGAIDWTAAALGRIDCLINNAGIHPPAMSLEDTSLDELDRVLRVNFVSTFAGCKFAAPYLRMTRGTIINMSSMTAVLGQENSAAYAASKGAQLSLTKALALELGRDGIRVNAVLPSNVDTPLMRAWAATLEDPESALARVAGLQVLGRMAAPEEIGRVCLFLATEDSSFITGQGLEVDGGASLDY